MKRIYILIISISLLLLSSCVPETPDPPEGVWRCEDFGITLYIGPDYRIPVGGPVYLGRYVRRGEELKMFVRFGNGMRFGIYRVGGVLPQGGIYSADGSTFLAGRYRIYENQIHYILTPVFQERFGVETIIFNRVEDYEPIDPSDWFPQLFPLAE